MPDAVHAVLLGFLVLASCVWVGGYVAIAVVARVSRVLPTADRIALFRALGHSYLVVGVSSLVVALGTGAGLLSTRPWDGLATGAVVVAVALVVALGAGVVQARRMTRTRRAAAASPGDPQLAALVRAGARSAGLLRALIGVLTLALVAVGAVLGS